MVIFGVRDGINKKLSPRMDSVSCFFPTVAVRWLTLLRVLADPPKGVWAYRCDLDGDGLGRWLLLDEFLHQGAQALQTFTFGLGVLAM